MVAQAKITCSPAPPRCHPDTWNRFRCPRSLSCHQVPGALLGNRHRTVGTGKPGDLSRIGRWIMVSRFESASQPMIINELELTTVPCQQARWSNCCTR